jgi:hypothetical protein
MFENSTRVLSSRRKKIYLSFVFVILLGSVAKWKEGRARICGRSFFSQWNIMKNKKNLRYTRWGTKFT